MPATAVETTPRFAVSEMTQKIIKNFAVISDSLFLREGTHQRTVSQHKTVFALADFPEAWPKETGIYALNQFLGELSLFDKPTIEFKDECMVISSASSTRSRTLYRYSDPSTIMKTPDKTFPRDTPAVEFTLSDYDLSQLKKHTSQLKLETVLIMVKDGAVQLSAAKAKDSAAHGYKLDIPKSEVTIHDPKFNRKIPFKVEHLGYLLDGSYTVALADWNYGYFTNTVVPVSYYVTEQTKD